VSATAKRARNFTDSVALSARLSWRISRALKLPLNLRESANPRVYPWVHRWVHSEGSLGESKGDRENYIAFKLVKYVRDYSMKREEVVHILEIYLK
jgi:hypothetical protein